VLLGTEGKKWIDIMIHAFERHVGCWKELLVDIQNRNNGLLIFPQDEV
jgi:hypothetical protein